MNQGNIVGTISLDCCERNGARTETFMDNYKIGTGEIFRRRGGLLFISLRTKQGVKWGAIAGFKCESTKTPSNAKDVFVKHQFEPQTTGSLQNENRTVSPNVMNR